MVSALMCFQKRPWPSGSPSEDSNGDTFGLRAADFGAEGGFGVDGFFLHSDGSSRGTSLSGERKEKKEGESLRCMKKGYCYRRQRERDWSSIGLHTYKY